MSEIFYPKDEQDVSDFIFDSFNKNNPIEIIGHGSKKIGRIIQCSQTLSLKSMNGILEYFPEELYIKVLPGTPLNFIESALKEKNQNLGFEPNDLGYIYKSTKCHNDAKVHLIKNFYSITKQKIARFFSVHAHLSIDFAFKPKNWVNHFSTLEKMNYNDLFKIIIISFFGLNYIFYMAMILINLRDRNKKFLNYFLIINLILYLYLLFVSFYGSTWEQERMRYTGYSFIFISTCLIIKRLFLQKEFKYIKV